MDERSLPCSGKILTIVEIYDLLTKGLNSVDKKSVRVTGRLDRHDTETCSAVLVDPKTNKNIIINTRLVEPFPAKLGCLFQFIGELDTSNENTNVSLMARAVRCVDGLDLALYNQAVQAQRQYLNQDVSL